MIRENPKAKMVKSLWIIVDMFFSRESRPLGQLNDIRHTLYIPSELTTISVGLFELSF